MFASEDCNRNGSNNTAVVNNGGERNDKRIFITWHRLIPATRGNGLCSRIKCARARRVIWSGFTPQRVTWLILSDDMSRRVLFIGEQPKVRNSSTFSPEIRNPFDTQSVYVIYTYNIYICKRAELSGRRARNSDRFIEIRRKYAIKTNGIDRRPRRKNTLNYGP